MFTEVLHAFDVSPPTDLQTFCSSDESSQESDSQNSDKSFDLDMCGKEMLLGGLLTDIAVLKDIPQSIMNWLLDCMCHSTDLNVMEAAFRTYWTIIVSKRQVGPPM